jgi:predicted nucleotidyltransferase
MVLEFPLEELLGTRVDLSTCSGHWARERPHIERETLCVW